jgi:hypothetical protein
MSTGVPKTLVQRANSGKRRGGSKGRAVLGKRAAPEEVSPSGIMAQIEKA